MSSYLQALDSLIVIDRVNGIGEEEVEDEEAGQFATVNLPTSMVNLIGRPPMLETHSYSLPSQLLKFYHGGDWPQC